MLTVSDGVAHGTRDDVSGRALVEHLTATGFEVVDHRVTADGAEAVAAAFVGDVPRASPGWWSRPAAPASHRATRPRRAHERSSNVRRPVSPRRCGCATRSVDCREAWPGSVGQAIIVNTPGSTKGCVEQLDAVIDVLPHALRLLADTDTSH